MGKITSVFNEGIDSFNIFPKEAFKELSFCSHLILLLLIVTILNGQISNYCRTYFCLRTLLLEKNSRNTVHTFSFLAVTNLEKFYAYTQPYT